MKNLTHLYKMDLPHRANKQDMCWPAIPTIARDLKLSESTVRRALGDLKKATLLEKTVRFRDNGGCTSNVYHIKEQG